MGSQVYYRKWRPQTLADLVGQEHVTRTLLNALGSGRVSHAYLFCGPRGTGKTSTGRILAKAINCLTSGKGEPCNTCNMCQAITEDRAMDVIEVDAASNRGINEIRELRERANYAPGQARSKVYIIDEVHMLTNEASNALLKTLEEPPPHVIFILATTEVHKVIPTIMSRCQRFDFHRISQSDVVTKLASIAAAEGVKMDTQAYQLIARATSGSLRDAENLLEQLTIYYGAEVSLSQVQSILGITGDYRAKELVKHIVNNDVSAGIATINSVNRDGLDLRQFNRELVEYLRVLLLIKTGSEVDLTTEDTAEFKKLAAKATMPHILKAVKLFGQLEIPADSSPLPLELALVDSIIVEDTAPGKPANVASAAPEPQVVREKPPEKPRVQSPPYTPRPVKTTVPVSRSAQAVKPAAVTPSEKQAASVPPSTPTPLPESASEIEKLKFNWKSLLDNVPAEVKKSKAIAVAIALLRSSVRPVSLEGDLLVLAFRHNIHKENAEKAENKQALENLISGFIGRTCRIKCTHEPEKDHLVRELQKMGGQIISEENI